MEYVVYKISAVLRGIKSTGYVQQIAVVYRLSTARQQDFHLLLPAGLPAHKRTIFDFWCGDPLSGGSTQDQGWRVILVYHRQSGSSTSIDDFRADAAFRGMGNDKRLSRHSIEGRITYMMAPISITLTSIHDGKLLPLGVTTARRSTLLPEVPTIAEAGVAEFDFPIWYGIWVPAGTPTGVVDKLSKDIARALATPDLRDWIAGHGGDPMNRTQPEFARFVQTESEGPARLSKAAGIKP
jgi:hypothetical protein